MVLVATGAFASENLMITEFVVRVELLAEIVVDKAIVLEKCVVEGVVVVVVVVLLCRAVHEEALKVALKLSQYLGTGSVRLNTLRTFSQDGVGAPFKYQLDSQH